MSAARPDTWMPLYVADYLADTITLTCEEHGAYLLLIIDYWRRQAPLPDDDTTLAKTVRLPMKRWRVVRATIATFFRVDEDGWHHKRIDNEIAEAAARQQRQQQRTSAATQARRNRNDERNVDRNEQRNDERDDEPEDNVTMNVTNNVTLSSSPSPSPEEARAEASESDAARANRNAAVEIIGAFDRAIQRAWPENPRPNPATTDLVYAEKWLKAGADAVFVETVADAVFGRKAQRGERRPDVLKYLDNPVLEALGERSNGHQSTATNRPPKRRWTTYSDEKIAELERENAERERAKGAS